MSQPMGPLPRSEFLVNESSSHSDVDGFWWAFTADQMRAYAAQEVAAAVKAERERCAMVCELLPAPNSRSTCASVYEAATMDCAAAIRAKDTP